ncbi:hypothetical protein ACFL3H_00320 [Gemmatimonadota bacterium]
MNGIKQAIQGINIPPGVMSTIPALHALLQKVYGKWWSFKVSYQFRGNGQITILAELRLGKSRR